MIAGCFFFPLRRGSAREADDGLTSSDMVMDCAKIELVVKRREGRKRVGESLRGRQDSGEY